nr:hypothetical protein [uncultured Aminipila sp.]
MDGIQNRWKDTSCPAQLAQALKEELQNKNLVLDLILTKGVFQTFLYLGVINIILIVLGAQTLVIPPRGHEITGVTETVESDSKDYTSFFKHMKKNYILL